MKNLTFILLSVFASMAASAQTLTLRFENPSQTKTNTNTAGNYRIDVDGKKYYSTSASATTASKSKQLVINKLALGPHTLNVYELVNNSTPNTGTKPVAAYSNTFQLRTGYDMVISIRRNGVVSFSEKKMDQSTTSIAPQPMNDSVFTKLVKSVSDKWSQTSRFDAEKATFANKTYFF
ncbi:MAG TPA: hypothetical protein VEV87_03725, partial [Chitinophagaceae bacterium]|nr:hypothetical protein [Chitinophagaceae bacterium]